VNKPITIATRRLPAPRVLPNSTPPRPIGRPRLRRDFSVWSGALHYWPPHHGSSHR
jgi:hypothetical protein